MSKITIVNVRSDFYFDFSFLENLDDFQLILKITKLQKRFEKEEGGGHFNSVHDK